MQFPLKLPVAFSAATVLALSLIGRSAVAQSAITIDPILASALTRKVELRQMGYQPYWISYADCIADDVLTFSVKVRNNAQQYNLEVWASVSADCTNQTNRQTQSQMCWQVFGEKNSTQNQNVPIRAQTLAAQEYGASADPYSVGTVANCDNSQRNNLTLYFMIINASQVQGTASTWTNTSLATALAAPPSNLIATAADNAVSLKWTASTDTNRTGYVYFCEEVSGDSAAGPDGGVGDCGGAMTSGERPVGANIYECGSTNSKTATSASITELTKDGVPVPLKNGQLYAIGVASKDVVLDVGNLSNVACVTPNITTDFFDAYRTAGGQAGGGICSLVPGRRTLPVGAPVLVLAGALAAFGVRRRLGFGRAY